MSEIIASSDDTSHTDFEMKIPIHRKQQNEQRCSNCYFKQQVKHVFISCYLMVLCVSNVYCETVNQNIRPFPPLFNAAQYRPVLTEPSQGTCGVQERSAYCRSSIFPISIDICNQDFCVQHCSSRSEIPSYQSLLMQTTGFSNCVFLDTINVRPGSAFQSASTSFISSGPTCFVTPSVTPDLSSTLEFTMSVWIWQKKDNNGTLIQKVSKQTGEIIFELNVHGSSLNFVYRSDIGLLTVTFPDKIRSETWTYVAIQVFGTSLSFFMNGVGPGFSAAHTVTLVSKVQEEGDSWVRVGLTLSGTYQFLGRLQDFRFYPLTLSNREIAQDYSGEFPTLRIQSHCRCPASHPRVKPLQVHYCIKNGEPDNTNDHVLRLNLEAHPLEYVNDGDANSIWISDFRNQVNLLVDLGDEFQVFYVVLLFYSPLPMAVEVQRKKDNTTSQWETWQQFASDCLSYFNTVDNGPLQAPISINCLKINQNSQEYSKGNITFNMLNPEPVPRPGYNDFYNTPELFDFVTARQVRVRLQDHFFVTNERHRYYGLYEYSVIARCECHGHAESCDHANLPYKCICLPESHTQGRQCGECQPLYNDKPFHRGDQVDAFSCRPCECYNHAVKCEYNVTLDPFPEDHYSGGGGVCTNCQHNTEGQNCETCIIGFYRPTGKSMFAEDVCSPCDCFPLGVQPLQMYCEKEDGQCACKESVEGRQCNICKLGFFNLTADNMAGCQQCDCSNAGTLRGDKSCSADTGQCNCKLNVRGFKCESCQYGFFRLRTDNPYGCEACNCNPFGSTNQYCDPVSGQCTCKANIVSRQCSECGDGFWAFEEGCLSCDCDAMGTEPPGKCDKFTGQCTCKINVVGLKCDQCKAETFGFGVSSELGCVLCTCNPAGTLNGSMLCDNETGDCLCKSNVLGASCNQCKGNTWGLSLEHDTGCIPCECNPTGTQLGDTNSMDELACNQNTGECACLANRIGRQCDDCLAGYFVSTEPGGGCLNCVCHLKGTLPLTECDSKTGQCECRGGGSGVTGISCDECLEGYYGFDGSSGSCKDCDCSIAGSVNSTCDPFDGQCHCKEFTTKRRCDKCISGSSFLDEDNPFGCSKAPDQQPPPEYEPINSTAIRLLWKGPDYPNGLITQYMLFRNGSLVYTLKGNERTMVDTGLQPYTLYSYIIQAENSFGSVQSAPALFRTPAGAPYGVVILNVTDIQAKSARFFWNSPQIMNGPLWKYVLYSETETNSTKIVQWEGQQTHVSLTSLIPFTNNIFNVDTCTTGGCLTSEPVIFPTMSAVPEGMSAPVVMALNNTALRISWQPPEYPNGIIIFYELWMRGGIGPEGVRFPSETRIFHPSGQYNPRPTKSPQENALPPPMTEYLLTGLVPFTLYEFQVLAENSAGKAASAWVSGRTGATTPLSTPTPTVVGFSPFSLNISWEAPEDDQSRGIIIEYRVYYYKEVDLLETPYAPPFMWHLETTQSPDMMYYILRGLSPYTEHTVMIEACNSVGCVNSTESTGRTNQDIPEGLEKPLVDGLNSSAMDIMWNEPAFPNGPKPLYTIQKTIPALSYPPQVISGTRFPGGGYYLFPPETIPPNVDFTGIRFWFRTSKREGLLLFAASEGQQSEFVALQFKHGRPWFLFDPQGECEMPVYLAPDPNNDKVYTIHDNQWHLLTATIINLNATLIVDNQKGCASFVTPNNDEGLVYSNNIWHQMVAWRDENVAYISIDSVWTGSRTSRCAKGTIIGPNTGVYIGGLPADFEVRRKSSKDQRLQIIDQSFQGCIRDIQIMQQKYPVEIWKTLDWNDAIHNELAFLNWEGCPINLDKGIHFMGQGYAKLPANNALQLENEKTIKFGFRTQMHTGILFFSYGGTGIYYFCAMINGAVHFEFANRLLVGSVTFSKPGVNFCDSQWYIITLEKKGQQAKITVDGIGTEAFGDANVELTVLTSSDFYVGGVPLASEAHQYILNNKLALPVTGFGGCIKDLKFDMFKQVTDGFYIPDFLESIIEVVNINMDGCAPYHLFPDQCMDDLITEVYNGTDLQVYDVGLHSYTDYLYRVVATNEAGSGRSPWGYGRTKEGSPFGVTAPYEVYHYNGYLVKFKWLPPVSTAGLMTKFVLQAFNLDNETILPVEAIFTNTSKREGNMTGTIPFTSYSVKMVACTSGGCSVSRDGLRIQTNDEAPENVPLPRGESGPRHIYVTWDPPAAPNGLLTGYFLYMDGTLVYTGASTGFNVTNELREYTSYVFYLKACTKVGCTQGPSATLSTAQLRPKFVNYPVLSALGTSSVEARWETPEQLNGVLERYLLYLSTVEDELGTVVYNNSDLFLDYTINGLNAGSTYYVTLLACTGGGCTMSDAANITTAESAPALIQPPIVTSPSPSQLHVQWEEPGLPNGKITQYQLYHNEIPKYTGLSMYYDVGGLAPYSKHVFRVVACTRSGCSSSKQTKAYTQESQPEGFVTMDLRVEDERTVSVKWTVPTKPNGNMFFDVFFEGLFYADPAGWDYRTVHDRRSLNHSQLYNAWVTITSLIPMSTYNVQVNASNTVGFILGNLMTANMPPGSPDGVKPPALLSQTPSTITATWISVGRENALDTAKYILQFKQKKGGSLIEETNIFLFCGDKSVFGPTTSFTYTMENLVAYTEYEFRLVAENSHGLTRSDWISTSTRQDSPAGFSAPRVVGIGPRYVDLVWNAPLTPNGIISEYNVYQNGQFKVSTAGNITQSRVDKLKPYSMYIFVVEVCTAGGCTRSAQTLAEQTKEDYPEDVSAPVPISLTPASVELTWQPPTNPNGVISLYTIERRMAGKIASTVVVSLSADSELRYVDEDSSLTPYVEYEYKLIASNGAGDGVSPWVQVTTMSSRPAGVTPPKVQITGPAIMTVTWDPPLQPNGLIEFYTIRLPEPQAEIRNISERFVMFQDLIPYTEYSVTVTACTRGGCTQSYPVNVRTHAMVPEGQLAPVATPVSQTMISVVWQGPERPNGPNIRFELSRLLIRVPLDPAVNTDNEVWARIFSGTGTFQEDRGLPLYSTYIYRVTVFNDIGQLTSSPSLEVTTFGGFPRRAAKVTAVAVSHTIVGVSWESPDEIDLQGSVKFYTVKLFSATRNYSEEVGADQNATSFRELIPNTQFYTTVSITIHGGTYITSDPVYVTTFDGAPEGVDTPTLSIVSETAIRVSWMAPEIPNGDITGYNIYVNDEKTETGLILPGSYIITGLQPYTVYEIQLEVCTVFDCVKGEKVLGSTQEALPQSLGSPRLQPLSSYQNDVRWKAPLQPNGIILRYDLYRRMVKQCSEIPEVTVSPELMKCTYIQCGILQNVCGSTCYSGAKVCCDGILHDSQENFACCGQNYAKMTDKSDICCGRNFHKYKENYKCCNSRYEIVLPGESCCPDVIEDRVAIGKGDSCCGTIPYSTTGSQICCSGQLHERHKKQCCGGEIVANSMVCCGDEIGGEAYMQRDGMSCCGQQYVSDNVTLCCASDTGHVKVHHYGSAGEKISANEKCCGIETISNGLSCCNFVGYNNVSQFCADISHQQSGCGSGTVCSRLQKDTAFCDRCDFDPFTYICGSVTGRISDTPTSTHPNPSDDCVVDEQNIYSGLYTDFLDDGLVPFSLYEYSVSVVNSAGTTQSDYTRIRTLQSKPEGLLAPNATIDSKQLYMIFLNWKAPAQPNGVILRFILVRDGIELYRGLDLEYRDDTTILPYRSYTYILTACTVAGCVTSPTSTVATAQAAPEGVHTPKFEVLNATSLLLSWSSPDVPNGMIVQYKVHFVGGIHHNVYNTTDLSFIITDLLPYTRYNGTVSACTDVACTNSSMTSLLMPESSPEGVYPPEVIAKSSTSVDVYWSAPVRPNGVIIFYALLRSDVNNQIHVFLGENFHVTDYSLFPGKTYMYFITTGNKAGNTSSEASAITMPDDTPANIPAPENVTVVSATQIFVQWSAISPSDGVIDQYRVLLNAGRQPAVDWGVGLDTEVSIESLIPFTEYEVRIQACLQGVPNGCGTGPGVIVKTFESAPVGLDAPLTVAYGPNIVDINWKMPKYPNGIVTQYLLYYRQSGSLVQLLINRVNNDTFHIRHAGSELEAFTEYEYKVVAGNSQGDVSSPWSLVRTKAALPEDLPQPFVTVLGAFSVHLNWVHPAKQNGFIKLYVLTFKKSINDPTVQDKTFTIIVNGSFTKTSIGGLEPYSEYKLRITAVNSAGNISSSWTKFRTGESSPSGLGLFDIEKIESGLAVILRWGTPVNPNGVITTYRIFEEGSSVAVFQGLNREFELRRLEPFTEYSVQLEACTSAGCTRSFRQSFFTAEIMPEGQTAPVMGKVTHNSVTITWGPPAKTNGKIRMYEVYRRSNSRLHKRSVSDAVVVYRTTSTDGNSFSYTDTNLQPFTEYQYMIKTSNSEGSTFSPWQSTFTSQAPPESVQPPTVRLIADQIDTLQITWQTPYKPNGIIQSYQLQRNDSIPLSFTAIEEKKYIDTGLMAFTFYEYSITACSGGGCTTSESAVIRTKEAAPLKVSPPTLLVVNSTSLRVTWQRPQITTGEISTYQLHMNDVVVFEGMELQYLATGLVPFTDYIFQLTACTAGGCTNSGEVTGKPDDDVPQDMAPPILQVMSSASIEISWQEPKYPNGVITSYDVRRNGRLIYTESISVSGSLRTTYTDYNLDPGSEYSYVVLARNRKGSVESPSSKARTLASSPSDLDPPKLSAVSATSIQVSWTMPASPNGVIKNFTLYKDAEIVYSGGHTQMNYIVPGLQFWTEYTFRVQACTERGCALSAGATVRTLSSKPGGQPPPDLLALANQDGAHTGVLIEWDQPQNPNGIILRFEVSRRQVIELPSGISYGFTRMVYNGSLQTYTDRSSDLLPFTKYEYMITAVNTIGKVNSLWKSVMTKEASPDSVPAPSIEGKTPTTITVKIHPPSAANGVVRYYNVLVNDTLYSTGKDLQQMVGETVPLLPYRFYAVTVQACTAGGCKTSPRVMVQTGSAKPTGQEPVRMLSVNNTAVKLAWNHPTNPNGKIRKFTLYQRRACPKMQQPFKQSCSHGDPVVAYEGMFIEKVVAGLAPYTAFEFQVLSVNDAGALDFPVWVRVETTPEAPQYKKYPVLQKNDSKVVVDWSSSFSLNGRLLEYLIMMDDGNTVYSGISSLRALERSSPQENLIFKIRCVTEAGEVESSKIVFDPRSANNIGTTPSVVRSTDNQAVKPKFYEEVWFIALMVVVGILLLLILLACCIRNCGRSRPYIRERLPLQSHQHKQPLSYILDASDGSSDGTPGNRDKSGYYSGTVVGVTNPSYVRGPGNKRHGSIDKGSDSMFGDDITEEDDEDYFWERIPDSGLVSNYDSASIEAPSYSITKEQTVFTDTHL